LLIGQIDSLLQLFREVLIPEAVRDECLDPDAPKPLREWILNPPAWLVIQSTSVIDPTLSSLDSGEQAAISLAQTLPADLLIIDERLGRKAASDRGIPIVGTIGILDDAARQGLIDLPNAIAQLQQTNFRIARRIIESLLRGKSN
jgi:predicted nucleic acid-binding protein